jgi:hypothetical protein
MSAEKMHVMIATVLREAPGGGWWLMNKRETGWSSSVWGMPGEGGRPPKPFPRIVDFLERWDVRLGSAGVDAHSVFVEVLPQ